MVCEDIHHNEKKMEKFVSVESEYERKPALKRDDVKTIKEWMAKQSHLPQISDLQIALFLNSCYFKIEPTKICIENYYTLRTHCPEMLANTDPFASPVQQAMHTVSTVSFPKLTDKNFKMIFIKLFDTNPEVFILGDVLKRIVMFINILGLQKGLQDGHVVIFDSAGLQMGHIFKLNIIAVKKFLYFVQEAMAIRLKEVHIINVTGLTEKFLNICKPFLKKELQDMIFMHRNVDDFYKCVPKEALPSDYGGSEQSFHDFHVQSIQNIEAYADFFIEDEKLKADESKRQGKRTDYNNIFGVEGNFKKLELD